MVGHRVRTPWYPRPLRCFLCTVVRAAVPSAIGSGSRFTNKGRIWNVARSGGAGQRVWVPRGQEFDAAGLDAATLSGSASLIRSYTSIKLTHYQEVTPLRYLGF